MRKAIFIITLLIVLSVESEARTKGKTQGYSGKISASLSADCGFINDLSGMISTSHGYRFNNGLWIGGGLGIFLPFDETPSFPFFTELKYSGVSGKVSPYISCRIGLCLWEFAEDFYSYISPEIGIDISNWSIFMSYNDIEIMKFVNIGFSWSF